MSNDRYTMFKNYMNNELGISRDDIKRWTKESVEQVATKFVKNSMEESLTRKIIDKAIKEEYGIGFRRDIKKLVADLLTERLEIKLK